MAREAFQKAIEFILPHETEYLRGHWGDDRFVLTENVAGDGGGATRYGIDQRSHPGVDVSHLTRDQAIEIYYAEWLRHGMDALPEPVAIAAFDVWVNGGHANLWLQEACNEAYPSRPQLKLDGELGPKSLAAIAAADPKRIVRLFLAERDARFRLLARMGKGKFLTGWLQRDADLRKLLGV